MERRHLVAVLAMVAIFVGCSRGFRALHELSSGQSPHLAASARLWAGCLAQRYAGLRARFNPKSPCSHDHPQFFADLNASSSDLQSKMRALEAQHAALARHFAEQQQMQRKLRLQQRKFALPELALTLPEELQQAADAEHQARVIVRQLHVNGMDEGPIDIKIPAIDINDQIRGQILPKVRCCILKLAR